MNAFFDELAERFVAAARERGVTIAAPRFDDASAAELLDFSRVVAHTKERKFAPLACYLAGIAVARFGPTIDVVAFLRSIRAQLEAEDSGTTPR